MGARYGVPIGAAAIRFVLRHPAVTAAVVGARTMAEVTENVSYLAATVPAELLKVVDTVIRFTEAGTDGAP